METKMLVRVHKLFSQKVLIVISALMKQVVIHLMQVSKPLESSMENVKSKLFLTTSKTTI